MDVRPPQGECLIYGLCDPRDGTLRYVGKTTQSIADRVRGHLREKRACKRYGWLCKLSKLGMRPSAILLERVPTSDANAAESFWIAAFRATGAVLLNMTDGGDGLSGHTPETRLKLSIAHRGRPGHPSTAETNRKISLANRGNKWNVGRACSEETKAKIGRANKGRPSPLKGKKQPPELVAKRAAAKRGVPLTAEHRLKLRLSHWRRKRIIEGQVF
jgi:hypothetical protein